MTGAPPPLRIGRYALHGEIGAGGMATVHLGRLLGTSGFTRVVAIKRLHAQLAKDPELAEMFLDEARLAARIAHPNVVEMLDVVAEDGELFLVMPYVHGQSLAQLLRRARDDASPVPVEVAASIMVGVLHGLHAAHEAKSEKGAPLHLVHRDVSPQNVLVGADGVARVIDFGVAKAVGRVRTTRDGTIRGKVAYMSPEQLGGESLDRRSDVYAAGVVLWELLTGQALFGSDSEAATLTRALHQKVEPPSTVNARVPTAFDEVVLRATERTRARRFGTAREMASALERALPPASTARVAEWVEELASDVLARRAAAIVQVEAHRDTAATATAPTAAMTPADTYADTTPVRPSASPSSPSRWRRPAFGIALAAACVVGATSLMRLRARDGAPIPGATPLLPDQPAPVAAALERADAAAPAVSPATISAALAADPAPPPSAARVAHPPRAPASSAPAHAVASGAAVPDPAAYQ